MTYYTGLVHKEKDSAFGVQFPDVPGCFSASDDMDHVASNATEALSLWAEDMTPPAPRSLEDIISEADVAAELAGGAFLISVPLTEID
jgi:predicted RNase H-like HicB family nuclease